MPAPPAANGNLPVNIDYVFNMRNAAAQSFMPGAPWFALTADRPAGDHLLPDALAAAALCHERGGDIDRCQRGLIVDGFVVPSRFALSGKSLVRVNPGVSSPSCENILIFRNCKSVYVSSHPVPLSGALRERHGRGAGCDGRGGCL